MTNEKLIQDKLEEIERLKAEIKKAKARIQELKEPTSIAEGVSCGMWKGSHSNGKVNTFFYENVGGCEIPWNTVKDVCLLLFSYKYNLTPKKVKVSTLNSEEIKMATAMAEEIVAVWNKYFEKLYREGKPPFATGKELEEALTKERNKYYFDA